MEVNQTIAGLNLFKYKGKEARKLFTIAYQTNVKEEISLLPED